MTYINGSGGTTYYEENLSNSTITLDNGTLQTGSTGIIFLDYHNTLNLSGSSTINGNIVVGWDRNTITLGANFVIGSGSNLFYSGTLDLSQYGFTGGGTVAVFGQYTTDGTTFQTSAVTIGNGVTIGGNLYVGEDPSYTNGLGGLATTGDTSAQTNPNALYGGTLTLEGTTSGKTQITLDGVIHIGGGSKKGVTGYGTLELGGNIQFTTQNDLSNGITFDDYAKFDSGTYTISLDGVFEVNGQQSTIILSSNGNSLGQLKVENGKFTSTDTNLTGYHYRRIGRHGKAYGAYGQSINWLSNRLWNFC
ncbi:hypothetical protein COMNV_01477 [Commensalibacter sp. Nvir]|uniref:hypothetical protein n=1 Tax=Commensalibacter sp. Nvir TaxID=3069817 RepID=UPI002D548082|nr:hypothetical protein COMNV_01477 [Commensalibacter sp. Nvir]